MTQPQTECLPILKRADCNLALSQQPQAKAQIALVIADCFSLCKTYGKTEADLEKMQRGFIKFLSNYPPEKIIKAFETHVERSDEIPTLACIISLIKRNGKPPLRESDIIAIRKKNGEDRTPDDWQMLREWEAQQSEGWSDEPTIQAEASLRQEVQRQRKQIASLEAQLAGRKLEEIKQSQAEISIASIKVSLEKPIEQKHADTIAWLRAQNAPEEDVLEYIASICPANHSTIV